MRKWYLAALLAAPLQFGCGPESPQPEESARVGSESAAADVGIAPASSVFVGEPPPESRLAFVGEDSTIRPSEYSRAIFLPLSMFSIERDGIPNELPPPDSLVSMLEAAGVTREGLVIVGEPIPSGRAYAGFDLLGLSDGVAILDGGIAALEDVQRTAPSDLSQGRAGLEVETRENMIVDARWVHGRLDDPEVAILDARPPDEFTGETPGEDIPRPGHIPGARNVFWQTLVESAENPRLKAEPELRAIFEQAGVDPGDTVVAYCRTGGQASFLYAVAKHLGYDVRLYDGSFIDWSRTDYPVER